MGLGVSIIRDCTIHAMSLEALQRARECLKVCRVCTRPLVCRASILRAMINVRTGRQLRQFFDLISEGTCSLSVGSLAFSF